MDGRTLPLFLGRRVLLPGAILGLPVLEERYRLMMDQLEGERFGITLITQEQDDRPGWHSVGTSARVIERQELHDRMHVLVVGERRFEVVEFLSEDPYPLALVEFAGEVVDPAAQALASRVGIELKRYLGLLAESGEGVGPEPELSEDPAAASYEVASVMKISNPERQELLELPTVGARLERELGLLRREIQLLEHVLALGQPG